MNKLGIVGIILAVIIIPLVFVFSNANKLAMMEEDVNKEWATVSVELKSRADLIPNLLGTVEGIMNHEKGVFVEVTEARSRVNSASGPAEMAEAEEQLAGAMRSFNVVVEAYPEIKSNENFLRLQDQLASSENRIAVARRGYNDKVRSYNTSLRRFPRSIIAGMFGYESKDYFEISDSDREVPVVSFD